MAGWPSASALSLRRVLVGLCALLAWTVPVTAGAAAAGAPPSLHARSAAILDMRDGAILWSDNGRLRLPMASTTKMMTALVACQLLHDQENTPMVVPPDVREAYGELLYLRPGDEYTFLQLLEGMLLPSANDAAIAIAVNAAGSQQRFIQLMNAEAQALGLTDTHFANPDGLEDPDHYSSAIDLAVLGQAAMRDPVIRNVVRMPSATIPWPDHGATRVIGNINALLAYFPGATGIKTGYTSQAMNVVVGSAERDGQSVIAVVMSEPAATLWRDEEALLRYGLALAADRPAGADPSPSGLRDAAPDPALLRPPLAASEVIGAVGGPDGSEPGTTGAAPAGGGRISAVLLRATPSAGARTSAAQPDGVLTTGAGTRAEGAVRSSLRGMALGGVLALVALASGLLRPRGGRSSRSSWRGRAQGPETWTPP